jgi:hypothetical protein
MKKTILVNDIRGIELHRQTTDKNFTVIDLARFPPGTYLVQVLYDDNQITRYFIKN